MESTENNIGQTSNSDSSESKINQENNLKASYAEAQNLQSQDLAANEVSNDSKNSQLKSEVSTGESFEHEMYDKILDELDIKPKEMKVENQDKQDKMIQTLQQSKKNEKIEETNKLIDFAKTQVQSSLSQDFAKIQKLMTTGVINSAQGQDLKKQVLKNAFDKLVQAEKIKRNLAVGSNGQILNSGEKSQNYGNSSTQAGLGDSNFFNAQGRTEVMNYLKTSGVNMGQDDLNKISDLVRIVEKSAIDRYLQKTAHEKTLRNSNQNAKQRLTSNAQKTGFSENLSRTFTREQIGKMSGKEFAKYERSIMEQLKKGQIR